MSSLMTQKASNPANGKNKTKHSSCLSCLRKLRIGQWPKVMSSLVGRVAAKSFFAPGLVFFSDIPSTESWYGEKLLRQGVNCISQCMSTSFVCLFSTLWYYWSTVISPPVRLLQNEISSPARYLLEQSFIATQPLESSATFGIMWFHP